MSGGLRPTATVATVVFVYDVRGSTGTQNETPENDPESQLHGCGVRPGLALPYVPPLSDRDRTSTP